MSKIGGFSDRCRCCLKPGLLQELWVEFTHDGQREVYGELLAECFAISLQPTECTEQICNSCIRRLRDAFKFKKLVLASEEHLCNEVKQESGYSLKIKNISSLRDAIKEEIKDDECIEEKVEYILCDEGDNMNDEFGTDEYSKQSEDDNAGVEFLEVEFLEEGDQPSETQPAEVQPTEIKKDNVGGRKRKPKETIRGTKDGLGKRKKSSQEEHVHKRKPKDTDETKRIAEETVDRTKGKRKANAKSRRTKNDWRKTKEFQCPEEAEKYVDNLKMKKFTRNISLDGLKVYYRCSLGAYRKNECPAQVYLLHHKDAATVSLFETSDHANHTDGNRGLKFSTRELIIQMYNDGIRKPNAIIAAFQSKGLPKPEKLKLNNFLASFRTQKWDSTEMSTEKLREWCQRGSATPEGFDEPFVLSHRIEAEDEKIKDLKIVISTKRLIQLCFQSNGVQTDTSFNLYWQGYPVLIVGSSDMDRVFHPFAIAVSNRARETDFEFIFNAIKASCLDLFQSEWNPVVLLADANDAVTQGFVLAFGLPYRRLHCNLSVLRKIDSELRGVPSKYSIRKDVEELHLCIDDVSFGVASRLFLNKWRNTNEAGVKEFLERFEAVWLGDNRYWYEGACKYYPSTNTALGPLYAQLKNECAATQKRQAVQLLEKVENTVLKSWSEQRDPGKPDFKPFHTEPVRSTRVWTETYRWLKSNPKLCKEKVSDDTVFYVLPPGLQSTVLSEEYLDRYKNTYLKWLSFGEFATGSKALFKIKYRNGATDCSCPEYVKKYVCKHSLGVLVILGKLKIPPEASRKK